MLHNVAGKAMPRGLASGGEMIKPRLQFAALVRVPASNCVAVPDCLDAELAAMTEPLSVSMHAVDLAAVKPGQRVLILGPGPIGLGIALFAAAAGAEVVLAGVHDAARLATATASEPHAKG